MSHSGIHSPNKIENINLWHHNNVVFIHENYIVAWQNPSSFSRKPFFHPLNSRRMRPNHRKSESGFGRPNQPLGLSERSPANKLIRTEKNLQPFLVTFRIYSPWPSVAWQQEERLDPQVDPAPNTAGKDAHLHTSAAHSARFCSLIYNRLLKFGAVFLP